MNLNELKNVVREVIQESSLSRIHQHVAEHDCAIITAFRGDPLDHSNCGHSENDVNDKTPAPASYQEKGLATKDINKLNNRDLKAKLLDYGYGVTEVDGSFIENFGSDIANEVKEDSLFVVNRKDVDSDLFVSSIKELGKRYCQDSVMIIPKGGNDAYLLGTNLSSFPGYNQTYKVGNITYGREAEFMTKVNNRPITTKLDEGLQTFEKLSRLEKMAVRAIAKNIK